ncbi:glycosyltransferase family 4 protein [Alphaproteobacteria bacterium]|nr:glycosyltransferase family 4 protein [Alphaproteobacteria bacterium]
MKKIFIGPQETPVTGQSVAFGILKHYAKSNDYFLEYPNSFQILNIIYFYSILISRIFTKESSVIYLSISRTRIGFLRDFSIIFLANIRRLKVTCHLHGADLQYLYQSENILVRFLLFVTYRYLVSSMIILTEEMTKELIYPIEFTVIPNAVSPSFEDYFQNKLRKKYRINGKLNISFVSNLIETKGILHLIDAVEKFDKDKIVLNIYGNDGYSELVDERMKRLPENIKFHGIVKGIEKIEAYVKSDIIALPSFYPTEAQPMCLIEAMYSQCAILFSNHSYLPDFFPMGAGRCVNPCDILSLVEAINEFLKNYELLRESGYFGWNYALSNCSSKVHYDRVVEHMDKLVNN